VFNVLFTKIYALKIIYKTFILSYLKFEILRWTFPLQIGVSVARMKRVYTSSGAEQILAELLPAGGETFTF
jgi:hypothetical protein